MVEVDDDIHRRPLTILVFIDGLHTKFTPVKPSVEPDIFGHIDRGDPLALNRRFMQISFVALTGEQFALRFSLGDMPL